MNDLIELKNSSYARKHVVDAEDLMFNFRLILEKSGAKTFADLISASGQNPELLDSEQLINAVVQMVVASNLFMDNGTTNNISLVAYTPFYGIPTQLIHNMSLNFMVKNANTGNTTITIPNLGTRKVLTELGEELSAGTLLPGTVYTVSYNALLDTPVFTLKSTKSEASVALGSIINLINSTGLTYSGASTSQMTQAVASYSLQLAYRNIIEGNDTALNNYRLFPFANYTIVPSLTNGMVFRFTPLFSNTLSNVTVQIGNLSKVLLKDGKGNDLNIGDIVPNIEITIKYNNGLFYLISNTLSSFSLQNDVTVNTISNDSSLSNSSDKSLVTENAVKQYVDSKDTTDKGYVVVSGPQDFLYPIPNGFRILAGNGVEPPYYNLANINNSFASPYRTHNTVTIDDETYEGDNEQITINGTTYNVENDTITVEGIVYPVVTYSYTIDNCFDGDNTTFYETRTQGSAVQGVGTMGQAGMEYSTYPCYIEVSNLNKTIKRVSLLCNKVSTMATQVFFEYSVDSGVTWQKVGDIVEISSGGSIINAINPTIYNVNAIEGVFSDIDIDFTPYINALDHSSAIATQYDLRCYAYTFPEQTVDTSENNYIHGWQITAFQFSYQDSSVLSPLVLSYDDQTPEIITQFTDWDLSTESEGTPDYSDGTYVVLQYFQGSSEIIPIAYYSEGSTEPLISDPDNKDMYRWVDIHDDSIITKAYIEDEDTQTYSWQEIKFVKLGLVTKSGNTVSTQCVAFNGKVKLTNLDFDSTTSTLKKTVNHNIGSLSKGKVYLRCISAEPSLGFEVGDTIELVNQATIATTTTPTVVLGEQGLYGTTENIGGTTYSVSISPDPHNHSVSVGTPTTKTLYTTIVCGLNTLKIYSNGITVGTSQIDTVSEIDYTKWKLDVICERVF